MKIMLVEDNVLNRDMLTRRLERQEFSVIYAVNGKAAIEMANSENPDLILMDLSLPILDGWKATKILKSEANTSNIPIIILTAHAMEGDREKAMKTGCDDYDTKPVDFKRLLGKINRLIS